MNKSPSETPRASANRNRGNGRAAFASLNAADVVAMNAGLEAERFLRPVPRGVVPSFYSFRHSAASHGIANGDGVEETSWLLGHKDSTVTRRVYIEEVTTAERSAKRRGRLEARMGSTLAALGGSTRRQRSDR